MKPHNYCETPSENCTMNYCNNNGCMNRKRRFVEAAPTLRKSNTSILKNISNYISCKVFNLHDWTSSALKDIPPNKNQLDSGLEGFSDYAKMYCDRCGKESKLNSKIRF